MKPLGLLPLDGASGEVPGQHGQLAFAASLVLAHQQVAVGVGDLGNARQGIGEVADHDVAHKAIVLDDDDLAVSVTEGKVEAFGVVATNLGASSHVVAEVATGCERGGLNKQGVSFGPGGARVVGVV